VGKPSFDEFAGFFSNSRVLTLPKARDTKSERSRAHSATRRCWARLRRLNDGRLWQSAKV
jgi:hypothetical protein